MHSLERLARLGIVVSCVIAVVIPTTASADQIPIYGSATPSPSGNGIDSSVQGAIGTPGRGQGGGGSGGTSPVTCTYQPIPVVASPSPPPDVTGNSQQTTPTTPGTWAYETCRYSDGSLAGPIAAVFLPSGGTAVSPAQLLLTAKSHLGLPAPQVQLSPATDVWQYVQMPTWAWVPKSTWVPLSSTTSAGAVSVTVVATPIRLAFAYQVKGDGTTAPATCNGPGTPYSDGLAASENPQRAVLAASPDCGWTWHQSSADTPDQKYAVSAHTVYHAVWTIRGAPGGGDLGELRGLNTVVRVTVGEIQALNTPPR